MCGARWGVLLDDVGAGDIGRHQIGRELDALEQQPQHLRHGAHQQRLRGAGQTGDQAMAADEQADADLLDDLFLANDNAADLLDDLGIYFSETGDPALKPPGQLEGSRLLT